MPTNKNVEKYLWVSAVLFVTFLLFGSFIASKNLFDIIYLIILYLFLIIGKIISFKS